MMVEALGEACASLQEGIIFTAPNGEVARGLVHRFRRVLAYIPKPLDQLASRICKLPGRFDPAPLKAGIANVGIEKQQAVYHRDQREDKADGKQNP